MGIYGTPLPVLKCSLSVIPSQKAYEIIENVLKRATKLMKKYKNNSWRSKHEDI